MKYLFLFLNLLLISATGFSQTGTTLLWQKTYGGSYLEYGRSLQYTTDGGYIFAGSNESAEIAGNHGLSDFWVVKTDKYGVVQWQKSYGGSEEDEASSIQQTSDGGYIIAGFTASSNGDVTLMHGYTDIWAVKIDASGTIQWQKTYGGTGWDQSRCIQQTPDGGYIIGGMSNSTNGDVTENKGETDFWIVKTDQSGVLQWQKSFGGSDYDMINSLQQSPDGGYIFAGQTSSSNGDVIGSHGMSDYWVVKTDAIGTMQWQKCYGGSSIDIPYSVVLTSDGGYMICGDGYSLDGDANSFIGDSDVWFVKTDQSGTIQWQKKYGGTNSDYIGSMVQTMDGGYLVGAFSYSVDVDVSGNKGWGDVWILKTDSNGEILWSKCFGGTAEDNMGSIVETPDGGYTFVGTTFSADGDITNNQGASDCWLVHGCVNDLLSVSVSDLTYCTSSQLTASNGFVSYMWNTSDTTQAIDVSSGGKYTVSATNLAGCTSYSEIYVPDPIQIFSGEQICLVTLDEATGKNVIAVNKTLNVNTDSIQFFRSDNSGMQYHLIGSLGIEEVSLFTDETAKPSEQIYQYRIAVKNVECNLQSELSNPHSTLFLQASPGEDNKVNLSWSVYEGYDFAAYQIFRGNAAGVFTKIDEVSNDTYIYTDSNPVEGAGFYQIRISPGTPCNPAKSGFTYSASNIVNTSSFGIEENLQEPVAIYPNPAADIINVKCNTEILGSVYTIADNTGRVVLSGKLNSLLSAVSVSRLSSGIYTFSIEGQTRLALNIMKK